MTASGQITSTDINEWLLKLSGEVGKAIDYLQQAGDEAPERRAVYERVWFGVYESLPGSDSVASRTLAADGVTIDEREAHERAKNQLKRADRVLQARMAQLSALQSVGVGVREEAKFDRTGPEVAP